MFAIYDNYILPRLIMIIIKIIILYFIQIRHTGDFSLTGTRLVPVIVTVQCYTMVDCYGTDRSINWTMYQPNICKAKVTTCAAVSTTSRSKRSPERI